MATIVINLVVGSRYPVNRKQLREHARAVLRQHGIDDAQVDVSIVGRRRITELNESLLKHDGATDVLSFPQHERYAEVDQFPRPVDAPPILGDVVICYPEAVAAARKYGTLVDTQLGFYLEHGIMHLLGYHHD
jgi:probable rRNA maturation factor